MRLKHNFPLPSSPNARIVWLKGRKPSNQIGWVRTVWLKKQDHVPYPSNDQKMPLAVCFRCVLTMFLDGSKMLDQGWVRTVWLKRNHAPSRGNLRTVQLKIANSSALPFKSSKSYHIALSTATPQYPKRLKQMMFCQSHVPARLEHL